MHSPSKWSADAWEVESGLGGESVARRLHSCDQSGSFPEVVVHDRDTSSQQIESNLVTSCVCRLEIEKILVLNSVLLMAVTC